MTKMTTAVDFVEWARSAVARGEAPPTLIPYLESGEGRAVLNRLMTEATTLPGIPVAAGIAIVQPGSILLAHPTDARWWGTYSIPKGRIGKGEAGTIGLKKAAIRETKEEIGVEIPDRLLDGKRHYVVSNVDEKGQVKKVLHYYVVSASDLWVGVPRVIPKTQLQIEEVDWAGFVSIEEARKRIVKYMLPILDHVPAVPRSSRPMGATEGDHPAISPAFVKRHLEEMPPWGQEAARHIEDHATDWAIYFATLGIGGLQLTEMWWVSASSGLTVEWKHVQSAASVRIVLYRRGKGVLVTVSWIAIHGKTIHKVRTVPIASIDDLTPENALPEDDIRTIVREHGEVKGGAPRFDLPGAQRPRTSAGSRVAPDQQVHIREVVANVERAGGTIRHVRQEPSGRVLIVVEKDRRPGAIIVPPAGEPFVFPGIFPPVTPTQGDVMLDVSMFREAPHSLVAKLPVDRGARISKDALCPLLEEAIESWLPPSWHVRKDPDGRWAVHDQHGALAGVGSCRESARIAARVKLADVIVETLKLIPGKGRDSITIERPKPSDPVMPGADVEVGITFGPNLTREQMDKLFEAQRALSDAGIEFDTGSLITGETAPTRDWEWDWSLTGPVRVTLRRERGSEG